MARDGRKATKTGTGGLAAVSYKTKHEKQEIKELEKKVLLTAPTRGKAIDVAEGASVNSGVLAFADLPVSLRMKHGLARHGFGLMTDIQRAAIPHALASRDILAAAKTGSGKTLAFSVPMLELLYRDMRCPNDGLGCGALIISPTRELAEQIYGVVNAVGKAHNLSAGCIVGGHDLEYEKGLIQNMNILVATPGRLIHHMHETVGLDFINLKCLVLDEADRLLDMGFKVQLQNILSNLPEDRTTWLFSATQSDNVKDLARLSLRAPERISVHATSLSSTPEKLDQRFMLVDLPAKVDTLYSFMKTHPQTRMMIFVSSRKQVSFLHTIFCKLRPGLKVLKLHGGMNSKQRQAAVKKFTNIRLGALICTDIAARGLDFPNIDWVVQADTPEDVATYIHRVGRTARFQDSGSSLLLCLPSEVKFISRLREKKIPVAQVRPDHSRVLSLSQAIQAHMVSEPEVKELGQKAVVSYARSVHLNTDKEVFDVKKLPLAEFAAAIGLPGLPRLKLGSASRAKANAKKNRDYKLENAFRALDKEEAAAISKKAELEELKAAELRGEKAQRKRNSNKGLDHLKNTKKGQDISQGKTLANIHDHSDDEDGVDGFLTKKSGPDADADLEDYKIREMELESKGMRTGKRLKHRTAASFNEREEFSDDEDSSDDDGEVVSLRKVSGDGEGSVEAQKKYAEEVAKKVAKKDLADRLRIKDAKKAAKEAAKKKRLQGMAGIEEEEVATYTVGGAESSSEYEYQYASDLDDDGSDSSDPSDSGDDAGAPPSPKRTERTVEDEEALALALLGA